MKKASNMGVWPPANPAGVRAILSIVLGGALFHAVLRLAQLGRVAPYGEPFVEKLEWYLFHAIAYDSIAMFPLFLPFLLVFWFRPGNGYKGRPWEPIGWALFLQALLLSFSALDHEMMRFLHQHGSLSQFRTYIGGETAREIPDLLTTDAGGGLIPILTVFGSGLLWLATGGRWVQLAETRQFSIRRMLWTTGIVLLVSYALLFHVWKEDSE